MAVSIQAVEPSSDSSPLTISPSLRARVANLLSRLAIENPTFEVPAKDVAVLSGALHCAVLAQDQFYSNSDQAINKRVERLCFLDAQKRPFDSGDFLVQDDPLAALSKQINAAKVSKSSIFIHAKAGTGSSTVAQIIHKNSIRAAKTFFEIDAASYSSQGENAQLTGQEGANLIKDLHTGLCSVRGGTLYIARFDLLPREAFTAIASVLEGNTFRALGGNRIKVDIRLILSSPVPLSELSKTLRINTDLKMRIETGLRDNETLQVQKYTLTLPSLAETPLRTKSLILQTIEFERQIQKKSLCLVRDDVVQSLTEYGWPGNLSELRTVIADVVKKATDGVIRPELFSAYPNMRVGLGYLAIAENLSIGKLETVCAELEKRLAAPTAASIDQVTAPAPVLIDPAQREELISRTAQLLQQLARAERIIELVINGATSELKKEDVSLFQFSKLVVLYALLQNNGDRDKAGEQLEIEHKSFSKRLEVLAEDFQGIRVMDDIATLCRFKVCNAKIDKRLVSNLKKLQIRFEEVIAGRVELVSVVDVPELTVNKFSLDPVFDLIKAAGETARQFIEGKRELTNREEGSLVGNAMVILALAMKAGRAAEAIQLVKCSGPTFYKKLNEISVGLKTGTPKELLASIRMISLNGGTEPDLVNLQRLFYLPTEDNLHIDKWHYHKVDHVSARVKADLNEIVKQAKDTSTSIGSNEIGQFVRAVIESKGEVGRILAILNLPFTRLAELSERVNAHFHNKNFAENLLDYAKALH